MLFTDDKEVKKEREKLGKDAFLVRLNYEYNSNGIK